MGVCLGGGAARAACRWRGERESERDAADRLERGAVEEKYEGESSPESESEYCALW